MTDCRRNIIALGIAAISVVLVGWFLAQLPKATSGETVGALASVVGGIIGALGSAAAVYLMLHGQRANEIEKVSAGLLREIAKLCESPIGQLGLCAQIQTGELQCQAFQLKSLFQTPTPVIFPAVANLIGRMPNPTLVVTFYMQLQETQGLLAVIENEIPPNEVLVGGHIRVLADL